MDFTEKKYYKLIKAAGVMGLTSQELKNETLVMFPKTDPKELGINAMKPFLNKMKKNHFIKEMKGEQSHRKVVYFIYEVTPHHDITGGFKKDAQSMDKLSLKMDKLYEFVCSRDEVSFEDMKLVLKQDGIVISMEDDLTEEELENTIRVMEFDKRIEKTIEGQYRATNYNFLQMGGQGSSRLVFTEIPCAHCKIAHMCSKDP